MNPSIFKSYDIRGLSPGELDETTARRIGKALGALYRPKHVVVGHDMRVTSTELEEALIDGLLSSGTTVTKIGLCSTPMFNFAIGESGGTYDLGVMVTASHNPAQYNGFKITRGDNLPIGSGSGMEEVRDLVISDEPILDSAGHGSVEQDDDVLERYVTRVLALADLPKKLPNWRIAIDAGNGMDGLVLPRLTKRLIGIEDFPLYWDLDGSFPNHEANPLKQETLDKLRTTVVQQECVFGVAFDGDGDRVGFVDETGEPIPGDILTALFAKVLLAERGPSKVLFDLRSSWSVPEIIQEAGGEPLICRVGHAHIKRQMKETGALFGGELSMHFYFSDLWNCESGDLAMLLLIKMLMREGKPLSAIWKPLRRYVHSSEINFAVQNAASIMRNIEDRYAAGSSNVSHLDGLRMEFRYPVESSMDWWFSLRASNTEPLLRLNLEARTVEEMEKRKAELSALIHSLD